MPGLEGIRRMVEMTMMHEPTTRLPSPLHVAVLIFGCNEGAKNGFCVCEENSMYWYMS